MAVSGYFPMLSNTYVGGFVCWGLDLGYDCVCYCYETILYLWNAALNTPVMPTPSKQESISQAHFKSPRLEQGTITNREDLLASAVFVNGNPEIEGESPHDDTLSHSSSGSSNTVMTAATHFSLGAKKLVKHFFNIL